MIYYKLIHKYRLIDHIEFKTIGEKRWWDVVKIF